jgi:fused signal recognition particle receptor
MFDFLRKKKKKSPQEPLPSEEKDLGEPVSEQFEETNLPPSQPTGFLTRLKQSLTKTRKQFTEGLASLILGQKTIDQDLLETIEEQLIMADIGISATEQVIKQVTQQLNRKEIKDPEALMASLKTSFLNILLPCEEPLIINESKKPFVILVVGVNGVGKTTTIGKICYYLQKQGLKVMLAAGDTFRAAAIQQLQAWGTENEVSVVAQHAGADSASVIFDALSAAQARGVDVLIADTAGRLHTQVNLMDELRKVKRVMSKLDPDAPHETLLILDSITGQNALNQAMQFNEAIGLSGLVLTKLDGTAKGGVIFAIAQTLKLPIRFIGIGESIEDLKPFQAKDFVEALFNTHDDSI